MEEDEEAKMILSACPECGGELQMTKTGEVYYTLVDGMWERRDSADDEIRVYCENDHAVTDKDAVNALAELPTRVRNFLGGDSGITI